MPLVVRVKGYRFFFFSFEGQEPPHIHVDQAERYAKFIAVPLAWFPRLQKATPEQRKRWRLIGGGIGLHWEDVDEDISVENLLATKPLLVAAV